MQERARDSGEGVARRRNRVARRERERAATTATWTRGSFVSALRGGDDERGASRGVVHGRGWRGRSRFAEEEEEEEDGLGLPGRRRIIARGERRRCGERLDARGGHVGRPGLGGSGEDAARDEFARGAERGLHRGFARGARERERSGRRARELGRGDAGISDRVQEGAARVLQRVGLVERPRRLAERAPARASRRRGARRPRPRPRPAHPSEMTSRRGRGPPAGPDPRGQTPGPEQNLENDPPDAKDASRRLTPRYTLAARQIRLPRVAL